MTTTSLSLLWQAQQRLPGAWERFQSIYEPLIRFWVQREPSVQAEADDLVQDLMLKLLEELPHFERRRAGSFRKWLRVLTTNRVREFLRKRRPQLVDGTIFDQLAQPGDRLLAEWNQEYERHVVAKVLKIVRQAFTESEWALYTQTEFEGQKIREVAQSHGVDIRLVYKVRHDVMNRLRAVGEEILEKDES
jgi:RNA polymerase sigma-70 factor, ECF subfamily